MRKNKKQTYEGWMLENAKDGSVFYTQLIPKDITSRAAYYKKKVSTKILVAFDKNAVTPTAIMLTEVTVIGNIDKPNSSCLSTEAFDTCDNCNCWKHTVAICS